MVRVANAFLVLSDLGVSAKPIHPHTAHWPRIAIDPECPGPNQQNYENKDAPRGAAFATKPP